MSDYYLYVACRGLKVEVKGEPGPLPKSLITSSVPMHLDNKDGLVVDVQGCAIAGTGKVISPSLAARRSLDSLYLIYSDTTPQWAVRFHW